MVNALANGISSMGSYFWGNSTNTVTVGNPTGDGQAPQFTEEVKAQDIVKEGFLWKQSRYLKQWKR